MKIYVFTNNYVWDTTDTNLDVRAFKTKEEALSMLKYCAEDETTAYLENFNSEDVAIDENEDSFEIYLKGRYCEYHTTLNIHELDIL